MKRLLFIFWFCAGCNGCTSFGSDKLEVRSIRTVYPTLSDHVGERLRVQGDLFVTRHGTYLSSKEERAKYVLSVELMPRHELVALDEPIREGYKRRAPNRSQEVILTGTLRPCEFFEGICLLVEDAELLEDSQDR